MHQILPRYLENIAQLKNNAKSENDSQTMILYAEA